MLVIVALYELLMAFTNFDIVYSLTQGGPGTATTLVTYFTWAESFKKLDFGARLGAGDHHRPRLAGR